ncbi:predicted protein, partial [Nematostella vectensis]
PTPAAPSYKYHDYKTMTQMLQSYYLKCPGIIRLQSIGKSQEGRKIWSLTCSLMDGATLDCEVDANSTFKELCESIREKLGLKSIYGFSIYIAAVDQVTIPI